MKRRNLLSFAAIGLAVSACAPGSTGAADWDKAKSYLEDGSGAVLAAAQAFLAGSQDAAKNATVQSAIALIESARSAIGSITDVSNWKVLAIEILAAMQQVSPIVSPFLGAAGPFVPLAVAVVMAFVNGLPTPPNAPPAPPAALHLQAARYRRPH